MGLTSVFYDGPVTETDRAKSLGGAPQYGVYGVEDFRVTAHPSIPYAVLVKAGKAHGYGVTDTATADEVVQCSAPAAGTVRWDLIVVNRNWQPALGGPSTVKAITAGTLPDIPSTRKTSPGVEDEQPLALVKWVEGLSAPQEIRDLRVWAGNGCLFAKDDLARQYLTQIGTVVNVDGIDWALRLGSNDIPYWYKSSQPFAEAIGESGALGVVPAGATVGPFWQAFPSGKFTIAPLVTSLTSSQSRLSMGADEVTKDGFKLYITNGTDTPSANGKVRWEAKQATATSAAG